MTSRKFQWLVTLWALLSVAAFSGCGDEEKPEKPGKKDEVYAKIVFFKADPPDVKAGESTTLSWKIENPVKVELFEGDVEIPLPTGSLHEGELVVTPETRTKYSLLARGEDGKLHDEAEVWVGVEEEEAPRILRFGAEPTEIVHGESSHLHWEVSDAESIEILAGGEVIHEAVAAEGSFEVTPEITTTYTLVARRAELEAREEFTLLVAPRILRFEANPEVASLDPEEEKAKTVLEWQVEGAEAVEIWAEGNPWVSGLDKDFGALSVTLDRTATFTLVAHGAGDAESRASVKVEVIGLPVIVVSGPERVGAGDTFFLGWEVQGATSLLVLKDGLIHEEGLDPQGGELELSLEETATFTFRATNAAGTSVEVDWVVEVEAPEILSFVAPERVSFGSEFEVSWETVGAVHLELRDATLGTVLLGSDDLEENASGTFRFMAAEGSAYHGFELRVWNGSGEVSARTGTIVGDGPAIVRFTVEPRTVTLGQPVEFTWEVATDAQGDAPTLTLSTPEGPIEFDEETGTSVFPADTGAQVYTLLAETALGTMSASVEVVVLPAPTLAFSATPEVFDPAEHTFITLEWTTTGADSLRILQIEEDGTTTPLLNTTEAERVETSTYHASPVSFPITFRAVATSPTGFEVIEEVVVVAKEVELNFTASQTTVTGRETTTLSWDAIGTTSTYFDSVFVGGTTDPFIDISTDPQATTFSIADYGCYDPMDIFDRDNSGCVLLNFPDDFTFPFAGDEKTAARIYVNGFISFDLTQHESTNTSFELTDASKAQWNGFVHLAPFWDNLNLRAYEGARTGSISYLLDSDDEGRFLVIQWSKMWPHFNYDDDPADLNFQVILREDGSFDYRYGTMLTSGSRANRALGSEASIGVRYADGDAIQVLYRDLFPGGLENFGLRFVAPVLPATGSVEVVPLETTTYTLYSEDGETSEDVTITVTPAP